jgi:DNA helicase-2/ATP-dependent DNA helicase PcrA
VAGAPASARIALTETMAGLAATRGRSGSAARTDGLVALLRPLVTARYTDSPARLNDIERLAQAGAAHEDLPAWLAEITLDPPASTADLAGPPHLDEDHVVVSTVHSAKGLEWPVVHVPHLVDGAFPSDMALRSSDGLEEEQRLLYVALTRARDELLLYCPLRMPHHRRAGDDRHSFAQQSRWLTDEVLALLDVHEQRQPQARPVQQELRAGHGGQLRPAVAAALDLDGLWH